MKNVVGADDLELRDVEGSTNDEQVRALLEQLQDVLQGRQNSINSTQLDAPQRDPHPIEWNDDQEYISNATTRSWPRLRRNLRSLSLPSANQFNANSELLLINYKHVPPVHVYSFVMLHCVLVQVCSSTSSSADLCARASRPNRVNAPTSNPCRPPSPRNST